MKILLVHLSDTHIKNSSTIENNIINRINNTIISECIDVHHVLIVITKNR